MYTVWSEFTSAAIGAFIGNLLTLLAAYLSHCWKSSIQKEKDNRAINSLMQAIIHDEIKSRGLIGSYRLNNDGTKTRKCIFDIQGNKQPIHEQMAFGQYNALVSYADVLGADHDNLKAKVTER